MNAGPLNRVDFPAIPEELRSELCKAAIQAAMSIQEDTEYQDRFRAWLETQKRTA
jgi:hypothetical protein